MQPAQTSLHLACSYCLKQGSAFPSSLPSKAMACFQFEPWAHWWMAWLHSSPGCSDRALMCGTCSFFCVNLFASCFRSMNLHRGQIHVIMWKCHKVSKVFWSINLGWWWLMFYIYIADSTLWFSRKHPLSKKIFSPLNLWPVMLIGLSHYVRLGPHTVIINWYKLIIPYGFSL